jgi:hypothetical protein
VRCLYCRVSQRQVQQPGECCPAGSRITGSEKPRSWILTQE